MKTYQASRANPDLDFFCCGGMDMNGSKKKKTHVFNPWSIFRLIFTNVVNFWTNKTESLKTIFG